MKFKKTVYGGVKEILKTKDFEAIGVMVDNAGVTANADGLKIVPAGTVVGGKTKPTLINENEVVIKKDTVDAEGVLLHDVDVTEGQAVGTMVIRGNVNLKNIAKPSDEAIGALKTRILFID